MANCNCKHEGDFEKLHIVYNEVMGKDGLSKSFIKFKEIVVFLSETTEKLKITTDDFKEFKIERDAIIRENEKHRADKKWLITTIVSLLAVVVTVTGIYFSSKNNLTKNKNVKSDITEKQAWQNQDRNYN